MYFKQIHSISSLATVTSCCPACPLSTTTSYQMTQATVLELLKINDYIGLYTANHKAVLLSIIQVLLAACKLIHSLTLSRRPTIITSVSLS